MNPIWDLRKKTGCDPRLCQKALDYAGGHPPLALAYLAAATLTYIPGKTFDEMVLEQRQNWDDLEKRRASHVAAQ